MEPGTFKDRVLVNIDPHLVIEGIILSGYAVRAQTGYFFIRPSYELDAQLIEREVEVARRPGSWGRISWEAISLSSWWCIAAPGVTSAARPRPRSTPSRATGLTP